MSDMHTKELWTFKEIWSPYGKGVILGESGEDVAYIWKLEDARRIVACVNACKGISTEDLEKMPALARESIRLLL